MWLLLLLRSRPLDTPHPVDDLLSTALLPLVVPPQKRHDRTQRREPGNQKPYCCHVVVLAAIATPKPVATASSASAVKVWPVSMTMPAATRAPAPKAAR